MKDSSSFDTETDKNDQPTHQTRKNTDTHTHKHTPRDVKSDTQLMLSQAIEHLESTQKTSEEKVIELYAKYSHDKQTITINGKNITFLVDSGATESVIQHVEFDPTPKMSTRYLKTVGASGTSVIERYTVPLSCQDDVEGQNNVQ